MREILVIGSAIVALLTGCDSSSNSSGRLGSGETAPPTSAKISVADDILEPGPVSVGGCEGGEGVVPGQCDPRPGDADCFVDEDFDGIDLIGEPCGDCGAARWECCPEHRNHLLCVIDPGALSVEICNGVDDDCDGVTDEGFSFGGSRLGEACHGIGVCGEGVVECRSDGEDATCSSLPGGSASEATGELCNGLDDDCDGAVDEGFVWNGSAIGQPCDGIGACGEGRVECLPDGEGATCSSQPDGSAPQVNEELCNNVDDDCDGAIDEDFAGAGDHVYDDDGDDRVLGEICGPQLGICHGARVVCAADGHSMVCDLTPQPESCDDLDNDCDGRVDNGFDKDGECVVATGLCAGLQGRKTCNPDYGADIEMVCVPVAPQCSEDAIGGEEE